jgi:hypothetical protein
LLNEGFPTVVELNSQISPTFFDMFDEENGQMNVLFLPHLIFWIVTVSKVEYLLRFFDDKEGSIEFATPQRKA